MAHRASHLLLAGSLLLAASPAFAQEGMLFKNLMEGVIGKRGGDDIEYRERPPLVVPPGSTLPRPQDPGSARSAAWPDDPDVARRRAAANASILPFTDNQATRNNAWLNQGELRQGPAARNAGRRPVVAEDHNNLNNQIEPIRRAKEEAARRGQEDLAQLNYGSEPPRRLLSEPPVGYRRPAGSAPVGPGQGGPKEDQQAVGQREFLIGTVPMQ